MSEQKKGRDVFTAAEFTSPSSRGERYTFGSAADVSSHSAADRADTAMLDAALAYAARGYKVFPAEPGGKRPCGFLSDGVPKGQGGYKQASSDPAVITEWWRREPRANIGLNLVGSGLVAVDADVYKPDCGWLDFAATVDLPETLTQRSASGGLHMIFSAPEGETFAGGIPGVKGVDIKRNGLILLEPSVFNGGVYLFANDAPIAPVPAWVPRGRPQTAVDRAKAKTPLVEYDKPANVERAKQYLLNDAPKQFSVGGDRYKVACRLKDLGVSPETCLDLMMDHWESEGDYEGLEFRVGNAYKFGTRPPGIDDPAVDFEACADLDVETGEAPKVAPTPAGRIRGRQVDCSSRAPLITKRDLIKGLIPLTGVGFLGGQSGAYKSFVLIDMAVSIASGEDFAGHKVKRRGGVLLMPFEGEGTIDDRLNARRTKLDDPGAKLAIRRIDGFGVLRSDDDFVDLDVTIADHVKEFKRQGVELAMLGLDTVTAAGLLGEDQENDAATWQRVVRYFTKIAEKYGIVVLLVHHAGKNASGGLRGSSAARAAADFVLMLSCDRDELTGESGPRTFALAKTRTGTEGPLATVTSVPVELGVDEDGEPITSLIMDFAMTRASADRAESKPTRALGEAFRIALADEPDGTDHVDLSKVRAVFGETYPTRSSDAAKRQAAIRQAFSRAMQVLPNGIVLTTVAGVECLALDRGFHPSAPGDFDDISDERDSVTEGDKSQSHATAHVVRRPGGLQSPARWDA